MRVVVEARILAGLDELCGVEPRRVLRFSEAEKAALRKAAAIVDQARELWQASVEYEAYDEDQSLTLAGIEWRINEVIDGIEI